MTIDAPKPLVLQAVQQWREHADRAVELMDAIPNTRGKVEVRGRKYTVDQALAAASVEATLAQAAASMAVAMTDLEGPS